MAAIDKTYVTSKEQYYEVKEWAKGRIITKKRELIPRTLCSRQLVTKISNIYLNDYILDYTEEEIDSVFSQGGELVLWNTPTFVIN